MENVCIASPAKIQISKLEIWRWIDFLREDAQATMGRDRKLFEEIKNGGFPILRFYCWKNPTLSYGRNQNPPVSPFPKGGKEGELEIVQRPTGGGKVLHQSDFCFSLIWRRGNSFLPWNLNDSYSTIHQWIQKSMGRLGIKSRLTDSPSSFFPSESRPHGWCFKNPVRHDLISEIGKIVGGAQRREKGTNETALHQGSIQVPLKEADLHVFKETFCEMFSVKFIQR